MKLKRLELVGFKSFAKKTTLEFHTPVTAIVGPNGSGKSNVVEAIRFVLGEQSMKSLRGKGGTDLVFKGSKALPASSRASVIAVFDNSKRVFAFAETDGKISLDFDEVSITREVFSDGNNVYRICGTEVRLKDVVLLLASVHIGATGHHIISQGQADHLLNANSKDRRAMIEDALGLKVYQYRIKESERKLEKVTENMKEVEAGRRELAPHVSFLKRQMEKLEKARVLRDELAGWYGEYFSHEYAYLVHAKQTLESELADTRSKLAHAKSEVARLTPASVGENIDTRSSQIIDEAKRQLESVRAKRDTLTREDGRLEGQIESVAMRIREITERKDVLRDVFPRREVEEFIHKTLEELTMASEASSLEHIKTLIHSMREKLRVFITGTKNEANTVDLTKEFTAQQATLESARATLATDIATCVDKEKALLADIAREEEVRRSKEATRVQEGQEYYHRENDVVRLAGEESLLVMREESLMTRQNAFDTEMKEAFALLGNDLPHFEKNLSHSFDEAKHTDTYRAIVRAKIKLEDAGTGGSGEITKEYEDSVARDEFLRKELADLSGSIESLRALIADLRSTLDSEFKSGIERINKEFGEFFAKMFGGGTGFLSVTTEHKRPTILDEEGNEMTDQTDELGFERGIEIHVSMPHKKVKDLHMLSGGERSLTSIALLFAMSQVNPPPFLVLDETDAALDEANSRRYGDMVELLSSSSELIVVTHNRETMSRAGILYGVTIGADGGSKLLSIKFDDAVKIAK
jgi:chromosome segregation ATPase